jgi:predicted enzyme related to lactoylglutathione lyase
MNHNPVGWFEIYVEDIDRAKAFYQQMLQVTLERIEAPGIDMWAFPMKQETAGAAGALVRMDGFGPGGNSVLVYFNCDDCAVEAARAVQAGGKIQQEKMSIGHYGNIALVIDTEGNMIGLHSMQ